MAKFKWDNDTISGNQITEVLISQYGFTQPVSVNLDNMTKRISYKNSLIPMFCNRCGTSFSMSPKMVCEAFDTRGYVCSNCGTLTDEEIRSKKKQEMAEGTVDFAKERGIDIEEIEAEREQKEQEEKEHEEQLALSVDDILSANEEIDEEPTTSTESSTPIEVEEETNESDSEDDYSKYMATDDDDNVSLEDMIGSTDDIEVDDFDDSIDADADVEDDEEDLDVDVETIVSDIEEDPDPNDNEKASDQSITKEPVVSIEPDEIPEPIKAEIVNDKPEIEPEETKEEEPEDSFIVNGERLTPDDIREQCIATEKEVKRILGYWPYQRKIIPENDSIRMHCGICGKPFYIDSIPSLATKVVTLTKEYCEARGIKYKPQLNNKVSKLSYCPHCLKSISSKGYNEYLRETIELICKRVNLTIINPEKYWFAGFLDQIVVAANGVEKTVTIREFLEKYDGISDARTLEEFKPRGTAVKSTTDEKTEKPKYTISNKANESKEQTETRGFKFVSNNPGPFNGTSVDSNAKFEEEAELQNSSVKENSVFHINQSIKDEHSTFAKLNDKLNPFARAKSLESTFQKSPFASFISDLSDETNVECTLTVNSRTFEIPIIDFENGFRIICVDIDNNSMTKIPYNVVSKCIGFPYRDENGKPIKDFKTLVLYSDSVERRRSATMDALIKFINPKILPYKDKKIVLEDTIFTQYTDYNQYLKEFDSQYSTFPGGKPKTGQLGIVATWTDDNSAKADFRSIMRFQMMVQEGNKASLNQLNNDYEQYMVASIKYIERLNKTTGRVSYVITDYVEIGSAIIADGFLQCVRALLREYTKKYPTMSNILPHIILEIDPNVYPSPSLRSYIEKGTLCLMDEVYKAVIDGNSNINKLGKDQHLKYTYVRRAEYRSATKDSDWCRQDMRMFGAGTLAATMAEELKTAGIASGISDDGTRLAFISNMGFTKNNQLEVKEYFVDQNVVQQLLMDGKTALMQKLPTPEEMFTKSGLVGSSSDGFNINSVMSNPALMHKYMNIMQNGTPEAKNYFINNVMYPNQGVNMMNGMFNGMNGGMNMMGMMNPMMGGMNMGMGQMPGMGMNMMSAMPGMNFGQ